MASPGAWSESPVTPVTPLTQPERGRLVAGLGHWAAWMKQELFIPVPAETCLVMGHRGAWPSLSPARR